MDQSQIVRGYWVIPPGFEVVAYEELIDWWAELNDQGEQIIEPVMEPYPGGLEFEAPLSRFVDLSFCLKIPTRLLIRIKEQECTTYQDLRLLMEKLPLREWGLENYKIDSHVSSRSSKLFHKGQIKDFCDRQFRKIIKPPRNAPKFRIDFRFFRDQLTVSFDLSGQALFKRGYKEEVGEAPLRENLASALLRLLFRGYAQERRTSLYLCDPMCGSGTFALEGFLMKTPIERPLALPHLKSRVQTGVRRQSWLSHFWLNEMSREQFARAKTNFESMKEVVAGEQAGEWAFSQSDFFLAPEAPADGDHRFFILNPPYGQRLKTSGRKDYFENLISFIGETYRPMRFGIVIPVTSAPRDRQINIAGQHYMRLEAVEFSHGGIPVVFLVFSREDGLSTR